MPLARVLALSGLRAARRLAPAQISRFSGSGLTKWRRRAVRAQIQVSMCAVGCGARTVAVNPPSVCSSTETQKFWRQMKGGKISHKSLNGIEEKEGGEEVEEGLLTRNE